MYKEIFEALKTKFQGVSEQILDRIAKNLAKTVTKQEDVQTAVDGVTFQQVLESYGDSRATDATKTAVLNYEKKHGLKDGKKVENKGPEPHNEEESTESGEDTPAWAKDLVSSFKTLSETVANMQGAELTKSRKQKLDEIIAPLSELQRKGYERISLKDLKDEEFDSLMTEIQGEVGEITKAQGVKGAVFGKPTVVGSNVQQHQGEASDKEVENVLERMGI